MPVIASTTLQQQVKGFEDGRLEIVSREISDCGCLELKEISENLSIPEKELRPMIDALVNNGKITCSGDKEICCKDAARLTEFKIKLERIRKQARG